MWLSALKGDNLTELKNRIKESLIEDTLLKDDEIILTNARHRDALQKVYENMKSFIRDISEGVDEVVLAIELRSALDFLGEITGEVTTEDILNHIFGKFCIGK